MKRILALLAASLLFTAPAAAQRHGEAAVLKIWDNRTAPHSNGIASPEREPEPDRIENVSAAELYVFPADSVPRPGAGRGDLPRRRIHETLHGLRRVRRGPVVRRQRRHGRRAQIPSAGRPSRSAARRRRAGAAHHGRARSGRHGLHRGPRGNRRFFGRRSPRGGRLDAGHVQTRLFDPLLPRDRGRESPGCRITFDRLLGGRRTDAAVAAASPSRQVTAENPPRCCSTPTTTRPSRPPARPTTTPETARHRGLAASTLGRTRLGPARLLPYRETWARRTRLARLPLRRPGRGSAAAEKAERGVPFAEYCLSLRK